MKYPAKYTGLSLAFASLFWMSCLLSQSPEQNEIVTNLSLQPQVLSKSAASMSINQVKAVQDRHSDDLLNIPGVVGTATGLQDGVPAVVILVTNSGISGLPNFLDGVKVKVKVTGEFKALQGSTGAGRFSRPVPIGVSTGHPSITAGTIGCRVSSGTSIYALSNNHVFANENLASIGDNALQPGPYDGGINPSDAIGTLADFEPIEFRRRASNTVDAALVITSADMLSTATPAGGYGAPATQPVTATIGMPVQKYGRTTGQTYGTISEINATVIVTYDRGQAKFVDQIIITGEGSSFSEGGDSGSLVVTNPERQPVGLLFAGSSTYTIINRIDLVLERFGVTIDGDNTQPPAPAYGFIGGTVLDAAGAPIQGAAVSAGSGASQTDASGRYLIPGLSAGDYAVTASEAGFESSTVTGVTVVEEDTAWVDFSLAPASSAAEVFVTGIAYKTTGAKGKDLQITVRLADNFSSPVEGASVVVQIANGSSTWTGSAATRSDGTVTFSLRNAPAGTYSTTVTSVNASGLLWDGNTPENSFSK